MRVTAVVFGQVVERAHGTHQDRLVKKLRLAGSPTTSRPMRIWTRPLRRNLTCWQQPQPSSVEHVLWKRLGYLQRLGRIDKQQQFRSWIGFRE
jgi:hypothetical protein